MIHFDADVLSFIDFPIAENVRRCDGLKLEQAAVVLKQLAALPMPILAIIAGRSVMHDPATARSTAERALRTKTVAFYPDASHAVNGEYPDRIAADVRAFLATHDRP